MPSRSDCRGNCVRAVPGEDRAALSESDDFQRLSLLSAPATRSHHRSYVGRGLVAKYPLRSRIPAPDVAVQRLGEDGVLRPLDDGRQPGLGLLGPFALKVIRRLEGQQIQQSQVAVAGAVGRGEVDGEDSEYFVGAVQERGADYSPNASGELELQRAWLGQEKRAEGHVLDDDTLAGLDGGAAGDCAGADVAEEFDKGPVKSALGRDA